MIDTMTLRLEIKYGAGHGIMCRTMTVDSLARTPVPAGTKVITAYCSNYQFVEKVYVPNPTPHFLYASILGVVLANE